MATTRIDHIDVGDIWTPTWTFKVGTTPTDPTTLVVKHRDPSGNVATITESTPAALTPTSQPISRISAGVYRLNLSIDEVGYWHAKADATGAVVASEAHEVIADPDPFTVTNWGLPTRALVGFGETKDWLQGQGIDTSEDLELIRVIGDISDRFHEESEREFKPIGSNPQTRTIAVTDLPNSEPWYIDGDYQGDLSLWHRVISVGDMTTVTTVVIKDTDWTTTLETVAGADMTFHRERNLPDRPIIAIEFQSDVTSLQIGMRVEITGSWGWPTVPGNVRQAVLDAIAETLDRDVEHYRQDFSPVETGGEANVVVIGRTGTRPVSLPPRALAVARSYKIRPPLG